MRTIYKRSSTGAILEWKQMFNASGDGYHTVSGQQGGAHVTSEWTVCEGKNIGRSNETSPAEQARLEVEANYRKKLAQGKYSENLEDIDKEGSFFSPMLAKQYEDNIPTSHDYKKGIVYSQPKLDGIRCIIDSTGMWTRNGKSITSCPHIWLAFADIFDEDPDMLFDGELYNHELKADFEEIASLVKKQNATKQHFVRTQDLVQYHMYDFPGSEKFSSRIEELCNNLPKHPSIHVVETARVQDQVHLDLLMGQYLQANYEGQIVRIDGKGYENKRSNQLLKRKEFIDEEFLVTDIVEGQGNRSGMCGFVELSLPDGRKFTANILGNREFYRKLLIEKDKYIGKEATVKYFRRSAYDVPIFPVVKIIHLTPRI